VPTYNRRTHLISLYESIIDQQSSDVEMVVVDDGSTDNTSKMISSWIKNNLVRINYIYQKNAGRAFALRKALMEASGEFTVIMDDDDLFVPDAFALIRYNLEKLYKYRHQLKELAGICGLCLNKEGGVIGDTFPQDEMVSSYYDIRFRRKISGDKKEILSTNILKLNMYKTFDNERRVPTSTLWYSVSQDYDMIFINEAFAIKHYLPMGMTDKNRALRISSPNSHIQTATIMVNTREHASILIRLNYSIDIWRYYFWGGKFPHGQISGLRLFGVLLMLPFGLILNCIERLLHKFS
jgi:glycosyltransferase involved in cell wall biosynthesis